ncbi:MAG: MarR family transcriptional regulator [Gammaproteobacteria bacterium]|nr:MAG: MarR family transcriptional regulator [Gammaproteobacteria bacterium]
MSEQLKLENQLCFRLYNINKAMTRLYAPLLKSLNLTYPQYLVMLVLWQNKQWEVELRQQEQALSVKALGKKLNLDSGTLSPLLKRMENLGFIVRKRNTDDERSVEVYLTKQGSVLKEKAQCIPASMFAKTGLTAEQLHNLTDTLDKLMANIQ